MLWHDRRIRDNLFYRIQSLGKVQGAANARVLSPASMGDGLTRMFGNVQGF